MASVDLHHAYYSVSIHAPHMPYLSFFWQGTYYHYLRLPNGYAQAPLLFTKLLQLPFGYLQSQGHLSVVYMDDSYLQGDSVSSYIRNVSATVSLLQALGFNINERKSVLTPTQSLEFLGFIISSTAMTLTLTPCRKSNIADVCTKLLLHTRQKIRFVSSVIGMLIAALPAVSHGALHYRAMEAAKNFANSRKFLHTPPITIVIHLDATLAGWGATDSVSTVGAPWEDTDDLLHINVLELTAARLALDTLAKAARSTHIQLKLDNLMAIAYINKMGGTTLPNATMLLNRFGNGRSHGIFGFLQHIVQVIPM